MLENGEYWMYLRKSRADLEAEAKGEGETLAKHQKALQKLQKQLNILVTREPYKEIVSGESLFHRPEMLRLLEDIEKSPPKGVLVMDMDRLGRGNMQEQGLILDTFRRNNVKIITPGKVYDLMNESDELMTEVQSLFARQELKMITRRMQRGRVASVEEGNYIGTRPPYGYLIHKEGKERYLIPHPEQADVVKQIFDWYVSGGIGTNKIANRLNEMGLKSYSGKAWAAPSVLSVIKNEVYVGLIQWKKKKQTKSKEPGKRRDTVTRDRSEWITAKGKHVALVTRELFDRAQEILRGKYHVPYQLENGITNPLAGLIRCGKCGASMIYRPYTNQAAHIMCYNKHCDTRSSRMEYVEGKILDALSEWLEGYRAKWGKRKKAEPKFDFYENTVLQLQREKDNLESQKGKLFDFLERGIYDEETFLERSKNLQERIQQAQEAIVQAEKELAAEKVKATAQTEIIPLVSNVIKLYRKSKDPAAKNRLLKSVLIEAVYNKGKHQRLDDFQLELFIKTQIRR